MATSSDVVWLVQRDGGVATVHTSEADANEAVLTTFSASGRRSTVTHYVSLDAVSRECRGVGDEAWGAHSDHRSSRDYGIHDGAARCLNAIMALCRSAAASTTKTAG